MNKRIETYVNRALINVTNVILPVIQVAVYVILYF
jgi:hypothetical protein